MFFQTLYSFLLAHLLCDFVLQGKKTIHRRTSSLKKERLLWNLLHCFYHGAICLVLFLSTMNLKILTAILVLSTTHFLIDYLKSSIIIKCGYYRYSIGLFLSDQVLHIAVIFLLSLFICPSILKSNWSIDNLTSSSFASLNLAARLLLACCLLIMATFGMGIFIRNFFEWLKMRKFKSALNLNITISNFYTSSSMLDGGFIIGILERLFIITCIVLKTPEVIGFVLATKSIARFKKFDDDTFVEIFIIGSFISFISAILLGVILRNLHI